jgi:hypothetical protein
VETVEKTTTVNLGPYQITYVESQCMEKNSSRVLMLLHYQNLSQIHLIKLQDI